MNPWLKTSILAVVLSAALCSIPFVLGWRGDAHMGNWIPAMAAGVCAAALLPSLLVSWLWHRYLSKKKSFVGAGAIAAVLTFVLFTFFSNPMLGGWFWIVWPGVGIFPLVFCGIPLIYFLACRKKTDPAGTDNERASPTRVGLNRSAKMDAIENSKRVFLLWHTHELPHGEEDSKLIGVYASEEDAVRAKERASKLPGFVDHPDSFEISPYEIGKDEWPEGFVTIHDSE